MQILKDRLGLIRRDLDLALLEVEKLQAKEALILDMLREEQGGALPLRLTVRQMLIQLLREAGGSGLNAAIALQKAEKAGRLLHRGTVSSLLSRLKNEGVVAYDGLVYRLKPPGT